MRCPHCKGRLADPRPTRDWSPLMFNPETGESYGPDSKVRGYEAGCTQCGRTLHSLDGEKFYLRGRGGEPIPALTEEEFERLDRWRQRW